MLVVGIDGSKGGWVAVQLRDGRFDGAFVDLRLAAVVAHAVRVTTHGADARTAADPTPVLSRVRRD